MSDHHEEAAIMPEEKKPDLARIGFFKGKLELADPNDDLLSAWDEEMEAAFEEGLQRTADLCNGIDPDTKLPLKIESKGSD